MDGEASEFQPKQERLRTRWTASLDKIFADLVVEQIQLGNRPNHVFDKKTWNIIRDEFNKRTDLNFNNNQLRKHLDVLRTRYHNVKSSFNQNDFVMDDPCCIGFDLWEDLGGQANKAETTKTKECPIYDQLCMIFADSGADGQYAQSSHYEGLDKPPIGASAGNTISYPENGSPEANPPPPPSSKLLQANTSKNNTEERKRKRASEAEQAMKDQESIEAMRKAIVEMVDASKSRKEAMSKQEKKFSITSCVKALDEIEMVEGIEFDVYYAALDLFEDANLRETFMSLKNTKIRLTWLQGKCGNNVHGFNLR